MQEERDQSVDQVREELARLLRDSPFTQRKLEELNGFRHGYLSQVLKGHITLTVRHLIGILKAVEVSPIEFFMSLSVENEGPNLDEIQEKMARYDAAFKVLKDKGLLDH